MLHAGAPRTLPGSAWLRPRQQPASQAAEHLSRDRLAAAGLGRICDPPRNAGRLPLIVRRWLTRSSLSRQHRADADGGRPALHRPDAQLGDLPGPSLLAVGQGVLQFGDVPALTGTFAERGYAAAGLGREQMKKYSTANFGLTSGTFIFICMFMSLSNLRSDMFCRQLCEAGEQETMLK
jgi:hypothetical protein